MDPFQTKMRPTERATFYSNWQQKRLRGLFLTAVGNSGIADQPRGGVHLLQGGLRYGGYPDIDDLFLQRARSEEA